MEDHNYDLTESIMECLSEDVDLSESSMTSNSIMPKADGRTLWTVSSTKLLLITYKEQRARVTSREIKSMKIMWRKIQEEMAEQGCSFSCTQLENKMKYLSRNYKAAMNSNKRTDRGRVACLYGKELADIFSKSHSTSALESADHEELDVKIEEENELDDSANGNVESRLNESVEVDVSYIDNSNGCLETDERRTRTCSESEITCAINKVNYTLETMRNLFETKMDEKIQHIKDCTESMKILLKQNEKFMQETREHRQERNAILKQLLAKLKK